MDAYRRVGRGGAGNFYTQKEIDEATKGKPDDLEAQKPTPTPADIAALSSAQNAAYGIQYARGGRGGAGNFGDAKAAAAAQAELAAQTISRASPSTPHPVPGGADPTAAPAATAPSRTGLSGRGGAGNWALAAEQAARQKAERERDEAARRVRLEQKVLEDVEAGLPMPPQAHTAARVARSVQSNANQQQ